MRCQHPVLTPERLGGEQIQSVSIDHLGQWTLKCSRKQCACPAALPQAGPDGQHRGAPPGSAQRSRIGHGLRQQLGPGELQMGGMSRMREKRGQPGASSRCRLPREPCGAGHAFAAADHAYVTGSALMERARAPRQQPGQRTCAQTPRHRIDLTVNLGRHAEIIEHKRPAVIASLASEKTGLQTDECHRDVCPYGHTQHAAGICVQARRDVDRQHRRVHHGIHGLDCLTPGVLDITLEPGAEERIDNDLTVAQTCGLEVVQRHARTFCRLARRMRVAP